MTIIEPRHIDYPELMYALNLIDCPSKTYISGNVVEVRLGMTCNIPQFVFYWKRLIPRRNNGSEYIEHRRVFMFNNAGDAIYTQLTAINGYTKTYHNSQKEETAG